MRETKAERHARLCAKLEEWGFTEREVTDLLRIERCLHRWAERECNGELCRDEKTGKCTWRDPRTGASFGFCADREAGALRRLARLMAGHPAYVAYHQGDPRGCALYVCARADLGGSIMERIESTYTRGVAVCV